MARDRKDMKRRNAVGKGIGAGLVAGAGILVKYGAEFVSKHLEEFKELKNQNIILSSLNSKKDELHAIKGKPFKNKHDKAKINELTKDISDLMSKRKR